MHRDLFATLGDGPDLSFENRNSRHLAEAVQSSENRHVRIIKETRLIPLTSRRGEEMTGRVQVHGVDLLSGARGFIIERHHPEALLVRDAAGEREFEIPRHSVLGGAAPFLIAPVLALLISRAIRKKG
jgi:hypothetical protein